MSKSKGALGVGRGGPRGVVLDSQLEELDEYVDAAGGGAGGCPYMASRQVLDNGAQIIFCPYNYLIDP